MKDTRNNLLNIWVLYRRGYNHQTHVIARSVRPWHRTAFDAVQVSNLLVSEEIATSGFALLAMTSDIQNRKSNNAHFSNQR